MVFHFDFAPLLLTALMATRLAPLFLFAPPLRAIPIPGTFRILLVVVLSFFMATRQPTLLPVLPDNNYALFYLFGQELLIGALIVFGTIAAFSAVALGGKIIDLQIGFGVANLFDPINQRQGALMGSALSMLAVAAFFATDSHILLLRVMTESWHIIPPGGAQSSLTEAGLWAVLQYSKFFLAGVVLVFPIMLALLLVDVGLALASRSIPQLGVFFLSLPVKVGVGLIILSFMLIARPSSFDRAINLWQDFVLELLR